MKRAGCPKEGSGQRCAGRWERTSGAGGARVGLRDQAGLEVRTGKKAGWYLGPNQALETQREDKEQRETEMWAGTGSVLQKPEGWVRRDHGTCCSARVGQGRRHEPGGLDHKGKKDKRGLRLRGRPASALSGLSLAPPFHLGAPALIGFKLLCGESQKAGN